MTCCFHPCPPGTDPRNWMALYGVTRQEWRRMVSEASQKWWDSLPEDVRKTWEIEWSEIFSEETHDHHP